MSQIHMHNQKLLPSLKIHRPYWKYILIQTSHSLRAQEPHTAIGYCPDSTGLEPGVPTSANTCKMFELGIFIENSSDE